MIEWDQRFAADKAGGTVLVLFVPSVDREEQPIDQEYWETETLTTLGHLFGGATAFPQGRGIWRDDETSVEAIDERADELRSLLVRMGEETPASNGKAVVAAGSLLVRMGEETRQGAVGFVIDRTHLEIRFSAQRE
jgi:hypothetical protein